MGNVGKTGGESDIGGEEVFAGYLQDDYEYLPCSHAAEDGKVVAIKVLNIDVRVATIKAAVCPKHRSCPNLLLFVFVFCLSRFLVGDFATEHRTMYRCLTSSCHEASHMKTAC